MPVVGSWVHRVRPHKRPDQDCGKEIEFDSPGWRTKPVVGSCAVPAFDSMPGQTRRGGPTIWAHARRPIWVAEEGPAAGDSRFQYLQRDDGIGNISTSCGTVHLID
ncbi:hypothetical protein SADUNF_Sadunf05G0083200 [Salix dunnii]|uniref:Uncharacterized protein n=1 Tax=Salix dunnii TaxID=1413687 RepID=A0A835N3K9_9ROSI|nr:hypothetical protein SADUNF_Sadunf05G0083200 [Salix dunnii]